MITIDYTAVADSESVDINTELDTQTELLKAIKSNTHCLQQQIELTTVLIELTKQQFN